MRKIAITGGNILTPLGDLQATWDGLLRGRSGLAFRSFPSVAREYPVGIIGDLRGTGGSWLRLKNMLDRLLDDMPHLPQGTGLFCATTKAAVDELINSNGAVAGCPHQLGGYIQDRLGFATGATMVSAACASGSLAVARAGMQIAAGACEHALVVGVDVVADFIVAGFDSLKALSTTGAKPFDRHRDGLSLGDGAAWMLLSAHGAMAESTTPPLAWLEDWGISCDATHITAPCRKASGLKALFDRIVATSGKRPGGIHAHGTGTVYNDSMELLAFRDKFDGDVPRCSVKGALGHSLGAVGLIEAMLSVKSLHLQMLPPTVGLVEAEEGAGTISGEQGLPLVNPSVISCNSGFGGVNCALYLTR